jgi:sugar lactone lactonase YvrE
MPEEGLTITGGLSGSVTMVTPDGTNNPAFYMPSGFTPEGGMGIYRVYPQGESLWLVLSGTEGLIPFGSAVVEVDAQGHYVKNYIDLNGFEVANNPDGTEEIYSNASDLAWSPDGTLYILDTGANTLYSWTAEGGLQVFHAWGNEVPTAVEFAANGDLYVGFLGEGIAAGAAKVEHWSADGSELLETFEGYTAITDIELDDDGTVYAVELAQLGEQGPVPNSGRVVAVNVEGGTPVAEGLSAPFGLALDSNGDLYVSTNSAAFGPPAPGEVVRIPLGE